MFYIRPMENYIRRRLGKVLSLEAAACDTTIIQQAETEWSDRPVVCLPGQLARATAAVAGHGSLSDEVRACLPGLVTHAPVIRYTLRNAVVHRGGFDAPGHALRVESHVSPLVRTQGGTRTDKALYCMNAVSRRYFGHWLQDACATALMQAEGQDLILDTRPDWPHSQSYIDVFGLTPRPERSQRVGELTLYQDYGQGSSKRARYAQMRARVRQSTMRADTEPEAVYLRRGKTGAARLIENDPAVTEELARRDFSIIDLEGTSASALFAKLRHARLVVSMDGSHLNHIYMAAEPGTVIVSFMPADRFTATNAGYARAAGMRFALLVAAKARAGYHVDVPDLLRTIDLAMAAPPSTLR